METIQLNKGQTFLSKQRQALKVQKGQVWVTIEGDDEDYILEAGQSLPPQEKRSVLLQGLVQASILFDTEQVK